jgi:hypothetical protein
VWLETTTFDRIAYFLHASPHEIQRYDMLAEEWLAPIALGDVPTAFTVDQDGLYVAFGRRTVRLNADGTGEFHLQDTASDVRELVTDGNVIYLFEYSPITSVNKDLGAQIDQADYFYNMRGVSLAPSLGKIFGRSIGVSPSDIVQLFISPDGTFLGQHDSNYHGDYPSATRTFVFPDDARVIDDSGIIYETGALLFDNSLAGSFDDLAFYGNTPIVLRGDTLYSYTEAFLEAGRHLMETQADRIAVYGEMIFAFRELSPGAIGVEATHVSDLSPLDPGQGMDPRGRAYTPDHIELGIDGIVYLLSKEHRSVFRWSIAERDYLETIPLAQAPTHMTYSPTSHRLYLAYDTGALGMVNLDTALLEEPFANSPQSPRGLATADAYLFLSTYASQSIYHPNGFVLSQAHASGYTKEYIWSPVNRKMYYFLSVTPGDLLWRNVGVHGGLGAEQDSPVRTSVGFQYPIRVAPDGSVVVLGSGWVFDAISLLHIDSLSNEVSDAVWLGGTLLTLREVLPWTEIQRWTANYGVEHSFFVPGSPIRLFGLENQLLIVSSVDGEPRFWLRGPDAGDIDDDTVPDHLDNCPEHPNEDQSDADDDGVGDACNDDRDADGDEWVDRLDNCPDLWNMDQSDLDGDGLGDACDPFPDHALRVRILGRTFGLTGAPLEVMLQLEDVQGEVATDLLGARVTLSLDGSATFGPAAAAGVILEGAGTQQALVEFSDGIVLLTVEDLVAESITIRGQDTEAQGIRFSTSTAEDFELDNGGLSHAGSNDSWEHGVPTSGPGSAYSGSRAWATNLAGDYPLSSDAALISPAYFLQEESQGVLEFQSWFWSRYSNHRGSIQVSVNDGASWVTLDVLSGSEGDYTRLSYGLSEFAGHDLTVRFLFESTVFGTRPGWYIDDFVIQNIERSVRFIDPGGDADADGLLNRDEVEYGTDPFDPDTDNDFVPDGQDNCPLKQNYHQSDVVHPNGIGDACDDPDVDGVSDRHDNCPDTPNPDQANHVHPNPLGDACDDPDGDEVFDIDDNCPDTPNIDQVDGDGDLVGTACDVCPTTYNPLQQETAACIHITEDGGQCLETAIELVESSGYGEIRVYTHGTASPDIIRFDVLATTCGIAGSLSVRINQVPVGSITLDPSGLCACEPPLQQIIVDDAELLASLWNPAGVNVFTIEKTGFDSALSWVSVLIQAGANQQATCLTFPGLDSCSSINLCNNNYTYSPLLFDTEVLDEASLILAGIAPFDGSNLPDLVDIQAVTSPAGRLCVAHTGAGAAMDCVNFAPQGEQDAAINGAACGPPQAHAGPDQLVECTSPDGALVLLDGSGSSDPNSTPGTNDDIVLAEWFLDFDTPAGVRLGEGEHLEAMLPLGHHVVTLRVTDSFGESATDEVLVDVVDTTPPEISIQLNPMELWPPNHRMVAVMAEISAIDACSPANLSLIAVSSSEPDNATGVGDGDTVNDVQSADLGTADLEVLLRAERAGGGPGRLYALTYAAEDSSGNVAEASAISVVPGNMGGVTEPLWLQILSTGNQPSLAWHGVPGALHYNAIRGELDNLRELDGTAELGTIQCLAGSINDIHVPITDVPPVGTGYFYLVEYDDGLASGFGTESAAMDRLLPPGQRCP